MDMFNSCAGFFNPHHCFNGSGIKASVKLTIPLTKIVCNLRLNGIDAKCFKVIEVRRLKKYIFKIALQLTL